MTATIPTAAMLATLDHTIATYRAERAQIAAEITTGQLDPADIDERRDTYRRLARMELTARMERERLT